MSYSFNLSLEPADSLHSFRNNAKKSPTVTVIRFLWPPSTLATQYEERVGLFWGTTGGGVGGGAKGRGGKNGEEKAWHRRPSPVAKAPLGFAAPHVDSGRESKLLTETWADERGGGAAVKAQVRSVGIPFLMACKEFWIPPNLIRWIVISLVVAALHQRLTLSVWVASVRPVRGACSGRDVENKDLPAKPSPLRQLHLSP